jgi:hypothetical protein
MYHIDGMPNREILPIRQVPKYRFSLPDRFYFERLIVYNFFLFFLLAFVLAFALASMHGFEYFSMHNS